MPNLEMLAEDDQKDIIIEASQDDDVHSDEEVVKSGTQTSFRDLLVVKDFLKVEPERRKHTLRSFKLWAPLFGGDLPYKNS